MGKSLVIAEKPSVATDLARVLTKPSGKFKREKDYYENDVYVISSAVGHLVEIGAPPDQEPKRGKWKLENLPVIPTYFELNPIKKSEDRFKALKKLIARKDVDLVINACDAGREGELIFRYLIQMVGSKKPTKRLWLQSMTPQSILENFGTLRSDEEMLPLASAAICRSEADWLVGINGTRALTAFNSQGGGFHKTTVGRVQTPTLTILVTREKKIKEFVSRPFWEVHAVFEAEAGTYEGRWLDEEFKRPQTEQGEERDTSLRAERIWEKEKAETIVGEVQGQKGTVEQKTKPKSQLSPLLFDLTSLQREANQKFGFPARMTLSIAQSLYEKHKALTYPRTDSRYLPDDYIGNVKDALKSLKSTPFGPFAGKILDEDWVKPSKRIFNQEKVSDHFAIIPTAEAPSKKLSETEEKIYSLVVRRFMAVFYPAAVYEITTRITRVGDHPFKTEGRVLVDPGWLAIYGKEEEAGDDGQDGQPSLVPVKEGEAVDSVSVEAREQNTKPPARFSEATLLSAMEGAGKLVHDEELRAAMTEKGLGTPATRASIIENLIAERYVNRQGRELIPTAKAFNLLETIEVMKIPALSSPELTGQWEYKLKLIEKNQLTRPEFMDEIQNMTREIVKGVRGFKPESVETREIDLIDPYSGQRMIETLRDFRSRDDSFVIPKAIAGRIMDLEEVRELLEKKVVGPLDDFRSRIGRPFSAYVRLGEDRKVTLDWGNNGNGAQGEEYDFSGQEPIGVCPVTALNIYETPNAFIPEPPRDSKKKSPFRLSKRILEQEISREQAVKLLKEGKTDVMTGFISKKTKRPFPAYLILKKDGTTGFEFPPRPPKKKTATSKKKTSTAKGVDESATS